MRGRRKKGEHKFFRTEVYQGKREERQRIILDTTLQIMMTRRAKFLIIGKTEKHSFYFILVGTLLITTCISY